MADCYGMWELEEGRKESCRTQRAILGSGRKDLIMKIITIKGKKFRWNYENTKWYKALCWAWLAGITALGIGCMWLMLCGAAAFEPVL